LGNQNKYSYLFALILACAFLLGSCSTSRKVYPVQKKRKNKKCDCPDWSYLQKPENKIEIFVLS
jgi:hypothetical protein